MNIRTSTGLAVISALGMALWTPAVAQEQADPDADVDGFVSREEATAYSEQRFDQISEGTGEITLEQLHAAIIGAEIGSAEAKTSWDPETEFIHADLDQGGTLDHEEWMTWRKIRFDQAAGAEGRVEAGLYKSVDAGGAMVRVNEGE